MTNPEFIIIDGSYGEAGGQILRTSLSLAVLLKRPVKIINIRAKRPKPGLRPQHLTCVEALAQISQAYLEGARIDSQSLTFVPKSCLGGSFSFDVAAKTPSAGAVSLVLQALFLPLSLANSSTRIVLQGGTHVAWSPPFHYLKEVFLPLISKMGIRARLKIDKWGWYPQGQGKVEVEIEPIREIFPLRLRERGRLKNLEILSAVSNLPFSIAQRQEKRGIEILKQRGFSPQSELVQAPSKGKGTFFFILAEFENYRAGFSSLGEIGKKAEKVAEEAVQEFLDFYQSRGCLDKYLADQIIPYIALARGKSSFSASELSDHTLTNIWVVEQFLPVHYQVEGEKGESSVINF